METPLKDFFARLNLEERRDRIAIIDDGGSITYGDLISRVSTQPSEHLLSSKSKSVEIIAANSIDSVLQLLSCWFQHISTWLVSAVDDERCLQTRSIDKVLEQEAHPLTVWLATSGSTGRPQWVAHNIDRMLSSYYDANKRHVTFAAISFDHIGGLDVLLYALASGSTLVLTALKRPDQVADFISKKGVTLVTATPTWFKWMALGTDNVATYPSVMLISLGGEPVDDAVVAHIRNAYPNARIVQKYGMTELHVLKSRTHPDDPRLLAFDPSIEYRVFEGELQIAASSVSNPKTLQQTEDGWLKTGDLAEVEGKWLRITGRRHQTIISGGENLSVERIQSAIMALPFVRDCLVYAEPNVLLGQIVCVDVILDDCSEGERSLRLAELKDNCRKSLPKSHWPLKCRAVAHLSHSARFKRQVP